MEHTQEQEISLRNLFWRMLFGWRRLIVLGIVFATFLGSLQYARGLATWKRQQSGGYEEEDIELAEIEQLKVNDILAMQKRMEALRAYQQESIWMNLDANHENVLILRYYVDSDYTFNYMQENEQDYTKDIVSAYCSYVTTGIVADAVAKELELTDQTSYISELITTAAGEGEDRSQNVFEVAVAYSDTETLEQIKPVIIAALEGQTNRISSEIGSHTLKLMTENIAVRVDKNLIMAQKEKNDTLYNYHAQLTSLEAGLNGEQKAALERGREEGLEEADAGLTEIEKPSFSVKYMILGLVAGVFLACVWIFMEVVFAVKIQEPEEISRLYGIRILGELKAKEQKKRLFHRLDSLLIKWKDRNDKQISQEQRIRIVSSNLEVACKQAGVEQIYITGSEFEKQQDKSLEQIWKGLSESGIRVCKGTNVVYDAKAIKEMAEIGNVVFVEQVGVSLYAEVEKEMKAAKDNGIQIIGSVIIS